jgi:hypothetical protein
VRAEIFDHLSMMVVGVRDGEFGQVQAGGFTARGWLQHILRGQRRRGFVSQRERVPQELEDVGFGFHVGGTVAILIDAGRIASEGGQMKQLDEAMCFTCPKRAHAFGVVAWNVQGLWREVNFSSGMASAASRICFSTALISRFTAEARLGDEVCAWAALFATVVIIVVSSGKSRKIRIPSGC